MVGRTARKTSDDRVGDHLRLCAVLRAERSVDELIRFVCSPDGAITPDLGRRLPGRGVWITADQETLEKACKANVFSRSLKKRVEVDERLPNLVGSLLEQRACSALGLANKAGHVVSGFDRVDETISKGQAALLVHGQEAAADGRGKLDRKYRAIQEDRGQNAPIIDDLTIEQLSLAIGRSNVVHAALIHGGVTDKFAYETGRLRRYRSGVNPPVRIDADAEPATTG